MTQREESSIYRRHSVAN